MNKYFTIAAILIAIVLLVVFRNKLTALIPGAIAATPPIAPGTPPPTGLDQNKILKRGVNGEETKFLQGLLGVTQDGIFGPQTEAALQAKKGVAQTSLAQYAGLPDTNNSTSGNDTGSGSDDGHWYDAFTNSPFWNWE